MTTAVASTKTNTISPRLLPKQQAFLGVYAKCGGIRRAASAIGINTSLHYIWLRANPDYAEAFRQAQEEVGDFLEECAISRATEGVEEPVFYQGEIVGYITRRSDGLLKFLLRGAKPHKYQERIDVTQRSLQIVIDEQPVLLNAAPETGDSDA